MQNVSCYLGGVSCEEVRRDEEQHQTHATLTAVGGTLERGGDKRNNNIDTAYFYYK